MGAHDFSEYVKTDANAKAAYEQLRADALHEHGHDPYNGSISTTHGYVIDPGMLTYAKAQDAIESRIDRCEKWGAAHAIEVGEVDAKYTRTVEKTLKITRAQIKEHGGLHEAIQAIAPTRATLRQGEVIDTLAIATEDSNSGSYGRNKIYYETRTRVVATKGAKETRYFVGQGSYDGREWNRGHQSLAAAQETIKAEIERSRGSLFARVGSTYNISAETRRASGEPLSQVVDEVLNANVVIRYELRKAVAPMRHVGWLFYGMAAS